jgi:hypothetical protein
MRRKSQRSLMRHSANIRARTGRFAAAAAIMLIYQCNAWGKCDEDSLAIDKSRDGDMLKIEASNVAVVPITYSVRVPHPSAAVHPHSRRSGKASGTPGGQRSEQLMTVPFASANDGDRLSLCCSWTIGLSGNTGHTAVPHLHFVVYKSTRRAALQSVPVTFASADGVVSRPRPGRRYLAISNQRVGG